MGFLMPSIPAPPPPPPAPPPPAAAGNVSSTLAAQQEAQQMAAAEGAGFAGTIATGPQGAPRPGTDQPSAIPAAGRKNLLGQ